MKDPFPEIEERVTRQLPALLYHYTSVEGLRGIATSGVLWATSIHHLNDTQELHHALKLASRAIRSYRPESLTTPQQSLCLQMMEYVYKLRCLPLYIASFSEEGDLLSQWRAYCPAEGGCSIGFSAPRVLSLAKSKGFTLYPCIYDREEQRDLVQFVVGSYLGFLKGLPDSLGSSAEGLVRSAAFYFVGALVRIAPLLKHPAFFEEREWRLVGLGAPAGDPVKSRCVSNALVPYREVRLAQAGFDASSVIRKVVIDPRRRPPASVAATREILNAQGMCKCDIVASEVPLRVV